MRCNIIGSGNSLRNFNLNNLTGVNICLNYTYKHFKGTDYTVFFDNTPEFIKEAPNPQYLKVFGGQWINKGSEISKEPMTIPNFNATFVMALAVAIHLGFKDIHCYGIDNRLEEYLHWYSVHKPSNREKEIYGRHFDRIDRFLAKIKPSLSDYNIYMYDSNIKHFINRDLRG